MFVAFAIVKIIIILRHISRYLTVAEFYSIV